MSGGPVTRFASVGRYRVAYQTFGDGPFEIVFTLGAFNNIDVFWEHPSSAAMLRGLGRLGRCVLFDPLGTGASDRVPLEDRTPWEQVHEVVESVVDAAELERPVVFGILDGGAYAIRYAVRHPDRTTALIIANTWARIERAPGYEIGFSESEMAAVVDVIEATWGTEEWSRLAYPDRAGDDEFVRWFARYQRSVGTPSTIFDVFQHARREDLRDLLPEVRVPTLVFHRADYGVVPVAHGHYLADRIPDARLVLLPGQGGMLFESEDSTLGAIEEFLTGTRSTVDATTVLAAVLFTDIVESTSRAAAVGDRTWSRMLDRHDDVVRRHVRNYGGTVVKSTGDGVLATFPAATRLVQCGMQLRDALAREGISIRAGGHVGDVELRGDDVAGMAVHTAARIASLANADELLVSAALKDASAMSGFHLEDRGHHELKGVPGQCQVFAVT